MLRFLRYLVEIVAALAGIAVICALLIVWRVSSLSSTSEFLTPYIETGVESALPGSKVRLETSTLTWDGHEYVLALHAKNVLISDIHGAEMANIPLVDIKISLLGLMLGQLLPKELAIENPRIKLNRTKEGNIAFGDLTMGDENNNDQSASEPADALANTLAENLAHASFMKKITVTHALFNIYDVGSHKTWSVSVPEISLQRIGLGSLNPIVRVGALDGRIQVLVSQKDSEASVDLRYRYNPLSQRHTLSSVFNNLSPALLAEGKPETLGFPEASAINIALTGKAEITFDQSFALDAVEAQIHGDNGALVFPNLWDKPCPIKTLDLKASFDRASRKLNVTKTRLDFGGPILEAKAEGVPSVRQGQDMDFSAAVTIDNLPMNHFDQLWPKVVMPNPRAWLVSNLREGIYDHAEVGLKGSISFNNLSNPSISSGSGKVAATRARVTYIDAMPPIEGVSANATFDMNKMDVAITGGGIGTLRLSPFTVQITGLSDIDQFIDIPLQVSGPLPEVLGLLNHEPFKYAKALGIEPQDLNGKISGRVGFQFPLLKTLEMKDIKIHAVASAADVASTKLIPGIPLEKGALDLDMTADGFKLEGPVNLGKAPFRIVWQEYFDPKAGKPLRHVVANGAVKNEQWANLGVTALSGTKGPINVSVEMTKPVKNKMLFSGTLDMTPAAVSVDMLKWTKPANVPAVLKIQADAVSNKPVNISSIVLRGTRVSAKGSAQLSSDMSQLLSFSFSPLVIGRTNATLRFHQSPGPDGALKFEATGASLDVAGLRGGNDPDKESPRAKEYSIHVDHLYTGDIGEISKAKGFAVRDKKGWLEIRLNGLADGDTPLSLELLPKPDGSRSFTLNCDSFGKALKGLGFTDSVKKGKIAATGQSTPKEPRKIKGLVKIGDFTVEKLPALALLLNAASPFGFPGLLTDSADFSRLRGEFVWEGDAITFTRAHAAGSAVGINVDGDIDMNSGNADLQGTIVPFSVINNVLNQIPLIGDLITGGEDQGILAVAYKIHGPLGSPKISVNPISLLTPGFIRNLFFNDNDTEEKAKTAE